MFDSHPSEKGCEKGERNPPSPPSPANPLPTETASRPGHRPSESASGQRVRTPPAEGWPGGSAGGGPTPLVPSGGRGVGGAGEGAGGIGVGRQTTPRGMANVGRWGGYGEGGPSAASVVPPRGGTHAIQRHRVEGAWVSHRRPPLLRCWGGVWRSSGQAGEFALAVKRLWLTCDLGTELGQTKPRAGN